MSFPDSGNPTPTIDSCLWTCGQGQQLVGNAALDAMMAAGDPACVDTCGFPDLIWERTHDGTASNWDIASGITTDGSDGIYVVGTVTELSSAAQANIWMRKYDSDGGTVWTQNYDAPDMGVFDDDQGRGVAYDAGSGQVFFSGMTNISEVRMQYFSARDATNGLQLWGGITGNPVDSAHSSESYGVAANLQGGGALSVGEFYNPAAGQEYDGLARPLMNDGNSGVTIGTDFIVAPTTAAVDDRLFAASGVGTNGDNIAYVAVGSVSTVGTGKDMYIAFLDATGALIDSAQVDVSSADDEARCVDARYDQPSGQVIVVVGGSAQVPGEGQNYWVRRLSSSANGTVWTKNWDNLGSLEVISGCAFDPAGNVIVGGQSTLQKFDNSSTGVSVWTRAVNGLIQDVATDSQGRIVVAGQREDDVWVAKYRP
jgi:hypothetical protein